MGNLALARAVKDLALPEHVVRAVVGDYMDFMARKGDASTRLEARLLAEESLSDLFYFEAQASMLGATLILTMEESVQVGELLLKVYGEQCDPDLLAMRRELVSRALHQSRDATALTGLSPALLDERRQEFCKDPS